MTPLNIRLIPLVIVLTLIAGCAPIDSPHGTDISMVPVEYRIGIDVGKSNQGQAQAELDAFVEKYWKLATSQQLTISASTPEAEYFAQKFENMLLRKGIDAANINYYVNAPLDKNNDFWFSILHYQVDVEHCDAFQVEKFFATNFGCYYDNARWQSFTRPERMIATESVVVED